MTESEYGRSSQVMSERSHVYGFDNLNDYMSKSLVIDSSKKD